MKKLILISLLFCGCNTNFVYIEKHIYLKDGTEHIIEMSGSSLEEVLKGNAQTGGDPKLSIPAP